MSVMRDFAGFLVSALRGSDQDVLTWKFDCPDGQFKVTVERQGEQETEHDHEVPGWNRNCQGCNPDLLPDARQAVDGVES